MAQRGATSNILSSRFDDPARSSDGDFLDWEADAGESRRLNTSVTIERPKSVLTRNDSPDIPFDRSFNAYRGCEHGCIYCFARPSHAFHGLSPGLDFETRLFAKPEGPALLRAEFARRGYRPDVLAMGTNTDPYQPIEADWRITRQILELCLETRHPVSITTKSDRILRDLDVLAPLAALGLVAVMLSVTTLDPDLARAMEPRASAPRRRLLAIARLAEAGVPVSVSASPLIPGLTDHELEQILEAAAEAGATGATSIPIRLPHEVALLFEAWLETHLPDRRSKVMNSIRAMRGGRLNDPQFTTRMKPETEWGKLHRCRLEASRRRFRLDAPAPRLRTDIFLKPLANGWQPALF